MSDVTSSAPLIGSNREQELLSHADYNIYAQTGQEKCGAYSFRPEKRSDTPVPAIIYFHGGLFDKRLS